MKKLFLFAAFLLAAGNMPAPDAPMDPYPGYWQDRGSIEREQKEVLERLPEYRERGQRELINKVPRFGYQLERGKKKILKKVPRSVSKVGNSLAQQVCKLYAAKTEKAQNSKKVKNPYNRVMTYCRCEDGTLIMERSRMFAFPVVDRIPTHYKPLGRTTFSFKNLSNAKLKTLLSSSTAALVYANGALHLQKGAKTSPHVDGNFAQQLCNIMNNPKNFKSMGMEKCRDCRCDNGMLVCKCMHREAGPVVRFNEQERFLNFNLPENHPVVVVPQNGYELFLGNLKEYLMKKLYQKYQQKNNPQPKDYLVK